VLRRCWLGVWKSKQPVKSEPSTLRGFSWRPFSDHWLPRVKPGKRPSKRQCVNERMKALTIGYTPGTAWASICICRCFMMRLFRPFCNSCSLRCCGGWRYLHGGSRRWHLPCKPHRHTIPSSLSSSSSSSSSFCLLTL